MLFTSFTLEEGVALMESLQPTGAVVAWCEKMRGGRGRSRKCKLKYNKTNKRYSKII